MIFSPVSAFSKRRGGFNPLSLNPTAFYTFETGLAAGDVAPVMDDVITKIEDLSGNNHHMTSKGAGEDAVFKGDYLFFEAVDSKYDVLSVLPDAVSGTVISATRGGILVYDMGPTSDSHDEISSRGISNNDNARWSEEWIGLAYFENEITESEIEKVVQYFEGIGAVRNFDFSGIRARHSLRSLRGCTKIHDRCLDALDGVTSMSSAFSQDRELIDLSRLESSDFSNCTDFNATFRSMIALQSVPALSTPSGKSYRSCFNSLSNVTTFPAGWFTNWSPSSVSNNCFQDTWLSTNLDRASLLLILTEIDDSGVWGTRDGTSSGTVITGPEITIDSTHTVTSADTDIIAKWNSLLSKSWLPEINGSTVVPT